MASSAADFYDEEMATDVNGAAGEDLSLLDVSHSSLGSAASSLKEDAATHDASGRGGDGCTACRWPVNVPGFVSVDEGSKTTYVSTHYPRRSELFATVRRACVRSLSCEVCPGREGPLLFGDEAHGYVFSYAFRLRDHEARGGQRWYSLILVMADHIHLISSWSFLVSQTRRLVAVLQHKAETADGELASKLRTGSSGINSSNSSGVGGGSGGRDSHQQQHHHHHHRNRYAGHDSGFRRRMRAGGRPGLFRGGGASNHRGLRSLIELTDEADLLVDLHAYLTWVLKGSITRLFERQLEGPSTIGESLGLASAQSAWQAAAATATATAAAAAAAERGGGGGGGALAVSVPPPLPPGEDPTVFESLAALYVAMEPDHFALVVFNAIIGNQVIVRGPPQAATSILLVLATLLPSRCCDLLPVQAEYRQCYECNFLGLQEGVEVPSHVRRASFVMIELEHDDHHDGDGGGGGNGDGGGASTTHTLDDLLFVLHAANMGEAMKGNTLLDQITAFFAREQSDLVCEQWLSTLREQWMHHAKAFFKFKRSQWPGSKTPPVGTFLQALGLRDEDAAVLNFWAKGLSSQHRKKLLLTGRDQ